MKKPLHIIYIPGIGDHKLGGQCRAISTWRWYGVEAEVLQMLWREGEWEEKFRRIVRRIDELHAEGKAVGLVAVSAGATAGINAFAARKDKLVGLVCIAGKINRPETIGGRYRGQNPAFVTSANEAQAALASLTPADRQRIQSRYGIFDDIVLTRDSRLTGAHNKRVAMITHILIISTQISFGAFSIIRFLKRQVGAQ